MTEYPSLAGECHRFVLSLCALFLFGLLAVVRPVLASDLVESELSLSLSAAAHTMPLALIHIEQRGSDNISVTTQGEAAGVVKVSQLGQRNRSEVVQRGVLNLIEIHQVGESNRASIGQFGIGNRISVAQYGLQQFSLQQVGEYARVNIVQY